MDKLLGGLPFVLIYHNGMIIFFPGLSAHLKHIEEVIRLFSEHGLKIKTSKCDLPSSRYPCLVIYSRGKE